MNIDAKLMKVEDKYFFMTGLMLTASEVEFARQLLAKGFLPSSVAKSLETHGNQPVANGN